MKFSISIASASLMAYTCFGERREWAVLVCGSRGWYNYRHHADVCHAFHTIHARGIPRERIITMMYDDVADSPKNPFPGKLFNRPNANGDAVDVYAGCKKDYTGSSVTPETFLNVIRGNSSGTNGLPVLESTAEDDVFINFVDHGAPGLVAFPNGRLHANDLLAALDDMHDRKMYRNLVFYMEACESGSMMQDLEKGKNIYAVTASNARESSWATYCPPQDDIVDGEHLHTCLGDDFSVKWLEDTDVEHRSETLFEQFLRVKNKTSRSHVLDFGDIDTIAKADDIGDFLGETPLETYPMQDAIENEPNHVSAHSLVDSRDVGLVSRFYRYTRLGTKDALEELTSELAHRDFVDGVFKRLSESLVGTSQVDKVSPQDAQEWECHRTVHDSYAKICEDWSDYSLKYSSTLLSLCEKLAHKSGQNNAESIMSALKTACVKHPFQEQS